MTTIDTITTAQINALMQSAGEAGDTEMVAICERTSRLRVRLGEITAEEREAALAECVLAINAGEAMA